ncbi:MAG: ATP-binding protein, partial [Pseudonocardiaceae bacterium]
LHLRRGQHGWLLGELFARAAAHPLDERVTGQLMLALYQCGRQAEALEHFQRLRVRLVEELGIDPGPELLRRYEQILRTDPALTAPTPASPPVSVSAPRLVPHQLPAHTPHFVGRAAELRQLTTLVNTTTAGGGTVVITAIDGTAGIGKTALALHWAHQVAQRFPDGQLYVNLRGFDPANPPMHPADALRGFLDAFAIPPARIPTNLDDQAGLYRSLLIDRHVLVVLDNVRDAEQARPLLPASSSCLVVITSRNQLTGLVAHEGAHPVTLDVLTHQEARALLTHHLGPDRVSAEPQVITDLIDRCARLPLALAIMAARAATHPGFALRVLAKELADEHTRLDALDTGDPTTSVRGVFSWSYQHLSTPAARMFRLLGLHPGPDITLPAATQLADLPPHQARDALGELARAHLLHPAHPRPIHLPRPAPRLRHPPHHRPRPPRRSPRRTDSAVRPLPAHRRSRDGHSPPHQPPIPAFPFSASSTHPPGDRSDHCTNLAGYRTSQPCRDHCPHRHPRLAHPHHPTGQHPAPHRRPLS